MFGPPSVKLLHIDRAHSETSKYSDDIQKHRSTLCHCEGTRLRDVWFRVLYLAWMFVIGHVDRHLYVISERFVYYINEQVQGNSTGKCSKELAFMWNSAALTIRIVYFKIHYTFMYKICKCGLYPILCKSVSTVALGQSILHKSTVWGVVNFEISFPTPQLGLIWEFNNVQFVLLEGFAVYLAPCHLFRLR